MIFKIGNRKINSCQSPLIIAEIGINHNGNLDQAIEIADIFLEDLNIVNLNLSEFILLSLLLILCDLFL